MRCDLLSLRVEGINTAINANESEFHQIKDKEN